MKVFHGMVQGEKGPVECVGVRYTRREMADKTARHIGGLFWSVGERIDHITSVNGANAPMPNSNGWFVRAVVGHVSPSMKAEVLGSFGTDLRELSVVTPLAELDALAGEPSAISRATKKNVAYDGRDYLDFSRFVLRSGAGIDQEVA